MEMVKVLLMLKTPILILKSKVSVLAIIINVLAHDCVIKRKKRMALVAMVGLHMLLLIGCKIILEWPYAKILEI